MRRHSAVRLIFTVAYSALLSSCALGAARPSNLEESATMPDSSSSIPIVPQTHAGKVLSGVLELLARKHSVREFDIGAVSVALGKTASSFADGHFGYRESLSRDWSYVLDVRRIGGKIGRFDLNFINSSAGESAPATELCEIDFEHVAAALKQAGYRQETNHGEHGQVVYEQFHRPDITVTVSTIGAAGAPPDKINHRCIQILTAQ